MKKDFNELFSKLLKLFEKYNLDTDVSKIKNILSEIPNFRVTAPLVGGFSTGKSSLINAVLGENLLSTNITPETAVPTEITYGDNTAVLIKRDETSDTIPLSEFTFHTFDAEQYSLIQLKTDNEFFRQIPTVKLVDMPGFDSGIEVHDKAIDEYLPESLAYILAVAADEGTLRESIIRFLNELKLYKVPVYTVITKSQKVTPEELENAKAHISDTIQRFLQFENIKISITNAKGREISVDEFKEILLDLQNQSAEIYEKVYTEKLYAKCSDIEKYLTNRLEQSDMSLEDIKLEKEQLESKMKALSKNFEQEKSALSKQIFSCIESIKNKIRSELNNSSDILVSMLLQGNDIGEKVNSIIRHAVTSMIQSELEPRLQKYMIRVGEMIQASIYDDKQPQLDHVSLEEDKQIGKAISNVAVPLVSALTTAAASVFAGTSLAASLGMTGAVLGPIGAAVGALAGTLISAGINRSIREKQERERKALAAEQVNRIIDSVTVDAGNKVEEEITAKILKINEKIGEDIQNKKEMLEKALCDTEERLRLGTLEREKEREMLKTDIEIVRGIRNGE